MAGRYEIYRGALKQSGILCVDSAEALLDAAKALSICTPPEGPAVAVLSGQAGPGMAACDLCEAEGLQVVPLSPGTQAKINELLPPLALRTNPVDLGPAWYNASAMEGIVNAVIEDERVDGVLLLMMFASANREVVTGLSNLLIERKGPKPILTCLVSPPGIWDEQVIRLEDAGVLVNLPTPERAARTMALLWQYRTLNARGPEPSSEDRTTQERR
jgi:acyl-CoA synthetase (NDP forming)